MVGRGNTIVGSGDVSVAILDGPVDAGHPCFRGARLEFPLGQAAFDLASPAARHGTHVASIIFGQPGGPITGLAPTARGIVLPVFQGGSGATASCSQMMLARNIAFALESGADIINISAGQLTPSCDPEPDLQAVLAECEERHVLVLAAAGNEGARRDHVPACVPTVLVVGAADASGYPIALSNWSSAHAAHGVLAWGEDVPGALPGGGTVRRSGTSYATAIASGAAAQRLAAARRGGTTRDPLALRREFIGKFISADGAPRAARAREQTFNTTGRRGRVEMHDTEASMAAAIEAADAATPAFNGEPSRVAASCAGKECSCGGGGAKDCGCGCGGTGKAAEPALVYALGQLGYDFGSEARRDSILQYVRRTTGDEERRLIAHLSSEAGRPDIERMIWTLNLDKTPIYALQPVGAFADKAYLSLLRAFQQQNSGEATLFAVPGRVAGSVRLMSGETVPVLALAARGLMAWDVAETVKGFVQSMRGSLDKDATDGEKADLEKRIGEIEGGLSPFLSDFRNMMTRKYRNLGITGRDRALNYASTSAFRAFEIIEQASGEKMVLDDIAVVKSAACRPGSDCYDVRLTMFIPSDVKASLRVFQFTLDVSDTIPVNIGEISFWSERPR